VSQKAATLLETLSEQALKSMVTCLECQFDSVIADRPFILHTLSKLYSSISKNQTVLSWEFFMNRFNTISLETQLTNDILSPVDISGINTNNPNFQRKLNTARFALKRSDLVKSISAEFRPFVEEANKNLADAANAAASTTATGRQSTPVKSSEGLI
jgi:protein unc-79